MRLSVASDDVLNREQRFWDEQIDPLETYVGEFHRGPDLNTTALIDALEPLAGKHVLDLGSGCGVLAAWLAARGARVTALDISPACISRAGELFAELNLSVETVCAAFPASSLDGRSFDRLSGRYVLHHLELEVALPAIARLMADGGRGAFLETMATNPVLAIARRRLVGRLGVPRYGTVDEHPLTRRDLSRIAEEVGPVHVVAADVNCFRLIDRQLLGYRHPRLSRVLTAMDRALHRLGLSAASYHQVVIADRRVAR